MMGRFPATTVRVTSVVPDQDSRVRITLELTVDVNHLADVSGQLFKTAVKRIGVAKRKRGEKSDD
jgi:hypothetical protein